MGFVTRIMIVGVCVLVHLDGSCTDGLSTNLWPPRAAPERVMFQDVIGGAPKDLGAFGKARLVELPDGDPNRLTCLVVIKHRQPRNNPMRVSVVHQRGSVRLPMQEYNGSEATIRFAQVKEPKGVFIYLTGIIGLTPPEEKLVGAFRQAGWHTIVSETSHNFFRRRTVLVDLDRIDSHAKRLGEEVNDHLADKAYAVEALLGYFERAYPSSSRGKRILAGGSAGGIAVPTVAARLGKADAIILIGTGGNASRIVCESSLAPMTLYAGGTSPRRLLDAGRRREFCSMMHENVPLDGLRLAPGLKGLPLLMLRAELDEMVPAATNDELFEALERPERWSMPVNHIMLFAALHLQSGLILNWAERSVFSQK